MEILFTAARWLSLIVYALTFALGIFHLLMIGADLVWPNGYFDKIYSDVSKGVWRAAMFSFIPETFVDTWTPFLFGLLGLLSHTQLRVKQISSSFLTQAIFLLVTSLFANLGYRGGLGIICGAISLISSCTSGAAFYVDPKQAPSFEFALPIDTSLRSKA